jgi:dephospho-CoA kinase
VAGARGARNIGRIGRDASGKLGEGGSAFELQRSRVSHGADRRTVVIGLTGPIGCGKSTVADWLASHGARVIDADDVTREVTAPGGPAHDAVLTRFGEPVRAADGSLDRAALARIVFADPDALAALEAIVHPAVRPAIRAALEAAGKAGAPAVVVEAIKLVEGGLAELCDEVWLVTCNDRVQRERLLARGASPEDTDRRIGAQAGMEERVRPAVTRVLDTTAAAADTRSRVAALWDEVVIRR